MPYVGPTPTPSTIRQGISYTEISKQLGCDKSTISYHVWRHLPSKRHPSISHANRRSSRQCFNCGDFIKNYAKKFCSNRCQSDYRHVEYIDRWRAGAESGTTSKGASLAIRRYLLETRGERCELCGWAERNVKTGNIPVEIDHIDGDWRNNKEENLRILCPNCHSLTATFKALNRGRGRDKRYQKIYIEISAA